MLKAVRLVIADVDGTLLTPTKQLTERARAAVLMLRSAGVAFVLTSGRPPRGLAMLVEPLNLTTPMAAFNGGMLVHPDLSAIEEELLPPPIVRPLVDVLEKHALDVWIYRGVDWFVRTPTAPHVDREAGTVEFAPIVVPSFEGMNEKLVKIVGVSEDLGGRALRGRCPPAIRRTRVSRSIATLLSRRDPPERQQRSGRHAHGRPLEGPHR